MREQELHCRSGWNSDLWEAASDDLVLDIRTRRPDGRSHSGDSRNQAADALDSDSLLMHEESDWVISFSMAVDQGSELP